MILVGNKIDSSVIDIDGLSQLERYYNYVNYQRRDKENANKHIEGFVCFLVLCDAQTGIITRNLDHETAP